MTTATESRPRRDRVHTKGYESYGWDEALEMDEEHEEWED